MSVLVPSSSSESGLRTCIGCRRRESPVVLLRVVAVDGIVIPDLRRRLPGRGAWLHPNLGCLDAAERRRAFGRSLRAYRPLDVSRVRRQLLDTQVIEPAGTGSRAVPHPSGAVARTRKQVDPS